MKEIQVPREKLFETFELVLREAYTEAQLDFSTKLKMIVNRQEIAEKELEELRKAYRELQEGKRSMTRLELKSLAQEVFANLRDTATRPPFNAEYVLYLLLRKDEREALIGDLNERYGRIVSRFNKRRADIWYYKQVAGSLWPLLRRALLRMGALVWLGRIFRRLIS